MFLPWFAVSVSAAKFLTGQAKEHSENLNLKEVMTEGKEGRLKTSIVT